MINWVIYYFYFHSTVALKRPIRLHLVQGDTKIVFYFKIEKILAEYLLVNEIFKFT